jgi:hypothetical protein
VSAKRVSNVHGNCRVPIPCIVPGHCDVVWGTPQALFHLFEGVGHYDFLPLAKEQTVALFAFNIA